MARWMMMLSVALVTFGGTRGTLAQVILDRPVVIYEQSGGRFTALEVRRLAPERYEVILRYDGSRTGIRYFRNEVDCQRDSAREIRFGNTLEEERLPRPGAWVTPSWDVMIEGSSRWRTVRLACNRQVYP